jgi:hypothetical protein
MPTSFPGYLSAIGQGGCQLPFLVICQPLVRMDANSLFCLSVSRYSGRMPTPSPGYLSAVSQGGCQLPLLVICQPLFRADDNCLSWLSVSRQSGRMPTPSPGYLSAIVMANPSPVYLSAISQNRCQSLHVTCQPRSLIECQSLSLSPVN